MDRTLTVTDHAVLRYMQRQLGIDVEAVREDLARHFDNPHSKRLLEFAADTRCKITVGDGFTYCFDGGVMTTCYPKRSG
ncbi:MAG: hypothetical protein OXH63_03660 [Gemmatimonadetes bacterium]|nr:hypothetical protein [Gemmatimonadota bacterium]